MGTPGMNHSVVHSAIVGHFLFCLPEMITVLVVIVIIRRSFGKQLWLIR